MEDMEVEVSHAAPQDEMFDEEDGLEEVVGDADEFETDNLESALLEALEDLTDEAALDAVRLYEDQTSLTHVAVSDSGGGWGPMAGSRR